MATADRATCAKQFMPSPPCVPISTMSNPRKREASTLCTACGDRCGERSTGATSWLQSTGWLAAAWVARRK